MYNAMLGDLNKEKIEAWASQAYPAAWQDLVKLGRQNIPEHGPKLFQIDRDVKA